MASELRVDRIIPVNGVPTGGGGGVIQTVYASTSTSVTNTTSTYQDTGLTATITPTSSTSKIVVLVQQSIGTNGTASSPYANVKLQRDGSDRLVAYSIAYTISNGGNESNYVYCGFNYLDSPATTSAVTYKTVFNRAGGTTARVQSDGSASTMILMEVSG